MSAFKEYVTSTAFKLSLSKVQIECISQIDQLGASWMFISTANALIGKGLIERATQANDVPDNEFGGRMKLTEAGKAVVPLLKMSGLYVVFPKWPEPVQLPEPVITIKRKATGATP